MMLPRRGAAFLAALGILAFSLFGADARAQDPDALLDQADQIFEVIQEQRGVPATRPVARAVLGRDLLLARIMEIVERELPLEAREAQNRLAVALGLVESDVAWFDRYLELLQAEIAGFYDDQAETFYILDDMAVPLQAPIMAHELFHALQDQRWGIRSLVGDAEWLTDAALAVQALIEGDALAVMTAYMLQDPDAVTHDSITRAAMTASLAGATGANTSDAPDAMWAQLVFPYTAGLGFVFELVEPGDWSPVDAAYDDPPLSTEQILHPGRYGHDQPTWLDIEVAVPRDAERYAADVFGEYMIAEACAQMLDGVVSRAACDRAADGWDGDRLEAFRFDDDPERDLVVWVSAWDDPSEAGAFAAVFATLSESWLGVSASSVGSGEHGTAWQAESAAGLLWVERWGDLALLVLDWHGEARERRRRDAVESAVSSVWATVRRSRYPEL